MTDKAIYFIKFGLCEAYLNDLVYNGNLFMNCAEYYRFCDKYLHIPAVGDELEGALFNGAIRKYSSNPLYCLYSVFQKDIVSIAGERYIAIQREAVERMCCMHKSFAVIEADSFINQLIAANLCNGNMRFVQVEYGVPSIELDAENLADITGNAVYIKRPKFSYQQEARICLGTHFGTVFSVRKVAGKDILFVDGKRYMGSLYSIGSIERFSAILSLDDVFKMKGLYYLPLSAVPFSKCFIGS